MKITILCSAQGFDISQAMLEVASDREVEGDLCLHDMGEGLPLRPGVFDGAISISAIQWLCNAVNTLTPPPHPTYPNPPLPGGV
jgi:18S rRNA (guanine1575-N7)-methyltransferase